MAAILLTCCSVFGWDNLATMVNGRWLVWNMFLLFLRIISKIAYSRTKKTSAKNLKAPKLLKELLQQDGSPYQDGTRSDILDSQVVSCRAYILVSFWAMVIVAFWITNHQHWRLGMTVCLRVFYWYGQPVAQKMRTDLLYLSVLVLGNGTCGFLSLFKLRNLSLFLIFIMTFQPNLL